MGTLKNRRFINMAPVTIRTAKTFRKCIRSVVQACNGKERQHRTPGGIFSIFSLVVVNAEFSRTERTFQ